MTAPRVVVQQDHDGEWQRITLDGVVVYEGHGAGRHHWLGILEKAGVPAVQIDGSFVNGSDFTASEA